MFTRTLKPGLIIEKDEIEFTILRSVGFLMIPLMSFYVKYVNRPQLKDQKRQLII